MPQFEQDLRQLKNSLAVLLGITPAELGNRLGESKPIPVVPAEVAVGMPAELLIRRQKDASSLRLSNDGPDSTWLNVLPLVTSQYSRSASRRLLG